MRVITGSARGKKLSVCAGDAVRPTPDRVKEALFSIVQFQVEGRRVLDLFAGSGQLGIEALSRGAREAVFVDAGSRPASVVAKNLEGTGLSDRARVWHMDFAFYLSSDCGMFDLAFLDPPYRTGLLQRALPAVAGHMNPGGTIVCENPTDEPLPESAGEFVRGRSYRYGKIALTLYKHKDVT
ncbi:16S rRNA (guanine(966)-N(2))-methyltransferase RsmD [Caproiciproducens sp. NJN-50]|uniref:16S rRNA (guanine(966)-N(2))-methyltransferase RsmD n=1 Tax=Acutalibacteraceae TaxID=3082771 RepID=UPI000FFE004B|nr:MULTISPECIES: 16S rRNA (guanine(966)-N(2))-methyltransferase RsmD [Acutalibacteraceae]QAT50152.1 16S rRNA (guanine(966)-N(2))-methyltransferase RsmD [Caproiciproducens sp. NJN-50]